MTNPTADTALDLAVSPALREVEIPLRSLLMDYAETSLDFGVDIVGALTGLCHIPVPYLDAFSVVAAEAIAAPQAQVFTADRWAGNTRADHHGLLAQWLCHLAEATVDWVPQALTAADATGWHLIIARGWLDYGIFDRRGLIEAWAPDLLGGWMFAAAGLTPAEARDIRATGQPDYPALRTMAALHRITLPAPLPGEHQDGSA